MPNLKRVLPDSAIWLGSDFGERITHVTLWDAAKGGRMLPPGSYSATVTAVDHTQDQFKVVAKIHNTEKGKDMSKLERLEDAAKDLLDKIAAEKALVERFGKDEDYADETVLFVKVDFGTESWVADRVYSYVWIKLNGVWYISGKMNNNSMTWDDLMERFAKYIIEVWIVSKYDKVF